jgi:hypothetical protein
MTGGELLVALQDPAIRQGVQQALGMPSEPIAESLRALAAAQARTEERLEELAAGQERLTAAQARTDAAIEKLTVAQARTEERLEELAAAQARTEESVRDLAVAVRDVRQALGRLSDNVGIGLEELAAIVLPAVLARDPGIDLTGPFERRFVGTTAGEEEIDLLAPGTLRGEPVAVVVESKSRAYEADVRRFAEKARRVGGSLGKPVVPVLFGFVIHPSAQAVSGTLGVLVVASRPGGG